MRRDRAVGVCAIFWLAAWLGLVATACAGGDDGVAVEPIEPILATDIEIVADPSGTAATLTVDTAIPVACAVIYGDDDTFGSIAVDSDMNGAAHEDHRPVLTGLEPDMEYRYILQGSDADGTIYRSDTMTFRTPVAADSGQGENLATGATVVGASSSFSEQFAAEQAIDGDLATEWSSAGDGDDAWIEIDLGRTQRIDAVTLRTRQMNDGSAIIETFTVTVDDLTLGPFAAGTQAVALDAPVDGRVVRFDAETTTGGNTGAVEVEIYGPGT